VAVLSAPASAATYHQATVFQPDRATLFAGGGSAAKFALSLTPDARCPTDTRTPPYYEAWGYILPGSTDPASVRFAGALMDLTKGFPLVEYGRPFQYPLEVHTGAVPEPGNEFTLGYFDKGDLLKGGVTSATWQIGIACVPVASASGVRAHYPTVTWRVHILVSADAHDPRGFTWRPLDHATRKANHAPTLVIVGLIGAFLAGSVLFVAGRRSGRRSASGRNSGLGAAPAPDADHEPVA
jgi:hypothetical protein